MMHLINLKLEKTSIDDCNLPRDKFLINRQFNSHYPCKILIR